MSSIVLLLSGGVDSVACLYKAVLEGHIVHAMFVDYGQVQAPQELGCARAACATISASFGRDVSLRIVDVEGLAGVGDGYVPARNLVLLSLAANYAHTVSATELWAGFLTGGVIADEAPEVTFGDIVWFPAESEDGDLQEVVQGVYIKDVHGTSTVVDEEGVQYAVDVTQVFLSEEACLAHIKAQSSLPEAVYPDTTSAFVNAFNDVLYVGMPASGLVVTAPFRDKTEVLRFATKVGISLRQTWSCVRSFTRPCGACASCVELQMARSAVEP